MNTTPENIEVEPGQGLDEAGGTITIYNPEQHEVMALLQTLCLHCVEAFVEVAAEAEENESLAKLDVAYTELKCETAERWIDSEGSLGFRCNISGHGSTEPKLLTAVGDKLRNRGWDGIVVVPR